MNRIYLAGAITGVPEGTEDWRKRAIGLLDGKNYQCLNPLAFSVENLKPADIVRLDKDLISSSNIVLVNADTPSWGTGIEIAYAKQLGIPVIAFNMPKEAELRSPWLLAHITEGFETLSQAVWAIFKGY